MNGSNSIAQGANGIVSGSMASGTENVCKAVVRDSRKGKTMSEYISRESVKDIVRSGISTDTEADKEYVYGLIDSIPSADVRPNIHGHWERMSDLPEDKDDRYKCSRCGNVVHHSNGVNLYHFNSWCGRCGSLNNSLIAGLESKGEKGE